MMNNWNRSFSALLIVASLVTSASAQTFVRLVTSVGNIDIELMDSAVSATVANFLDYVNDGDYVDSFFHRSDQSTFIQGGAFQFTGGQVLTVPPNAAIANEFQQSNVRGTISMLYFGTDPNTATSQWNINLADNSAQFDMISGNPGYTVFGTITAESMPVVDAIAALTISDVGGAFTMLPTINYMGGSIVRENLAIIDSASIIDDPGGGGGGGGDEFMINPGLNGAWFDPATPGQGILIEVLPNAGIIFMAWFTYDTSQPDPGLTAVIGDPGHRWLTAQGAFGIDSATLDLTITSGGLFDDPATVSNTSAGSVGSVTLAFTDCGNATLTYSIPGSGLSRTITLIRISNDNVSLCEQLNSTMRR